VKSVSWSVRRCDGVALWIWLKSFGAWLKRYQGRATSNKSRSGGARRIGEFALNILVQLMLLFGQEG